MTETDVKPLEVAKGSLLPPDYSRGRLRTYALVDPDMKPFAEVAVFSDGRTVACRQGGQVIERYRTVNALSQEWENYGTLLAPRPGAGPRRFIFRRGVDSTGFSGPGVATEGVVFTGGACVLMWLGEVRSLVEWESVEQAITVHGHAGDTVLEWLDEER